jgi:alkylmercury lyase
MLLPTEASDQPDGTTQRQLYTWCAWDSLFIPGLVGKTADVESVSPTSGAPIHLRVEPSGVQELTPAEAVVSMLAPTESFDHDVILSFCHYVHYFTAPDEAAPWLDEHPRTFTLSVDQAFELGRLTNRTLFGDAPARRYCHLKSEWESPQLQPCVRLAAARCLESL